MPIITINLLHSSTFSIEEYFSSYIYNNYSISNSLALRSNSLNYSKRKQFVKDDFSDTLQSNTVMHNFNNNLSNTDISGMYPSNTSLNNFNTKQTYQDSSTPYNLNGKENYSIKEEERRKTPKTATDSKKIINRGFIKSCNTIGSQMINYSEYQTNSVIYENENIDNEIYLENFNSHLIQEDVIESDFITNTNTNNLEKQDMKIMFGSGNENSPDRGDNKKDYTEKTNKKKKKEKNIKESHSPLEKIKVIKEKGSSSSIAMGKEGKKGKDRKDGRESINKLGGSDSEYTIQDKFGGWKMPEPVDYDIENNEDSLHEDLIYNSNNSDKEVNIFPEKTDKESLDKFYKELIDKLSSEIESFTHFVLAGNFILKLCKEVQEAFNKESDKAKIILDSSQINLYFKSNITCLKILKSLGFKKIFVSNTTDEEEPYAKVIQKVETDNEKIILDTEERETLIFVFDIVWIKNDEEKKKVFKEKSLSIEKVFKEELNKAMV